MAKRSKSAGFRFRAGFSSQDFCSPHLRSEKTSRSLCALSGDLADGRFSPAILPNGEADG